MSDEDRIWQVWVEWKDKKDPMKLGKPATQGEGMSRLRRLLGDSRVKDAWIDDGKKEMRPQKGDD